MTLNQLIEQLKQKGYKVTEPRKIILSILINNIETVITADELYLMVKLENKKINRSTVYRNIDILTELSLLYKTITPQGISKVKLKCTTSHHHHLICDICGKIVIYDDCEFTKYNKFAETNGFTLTGHTLELHGICTNCKSV